MRLSRFFRPWPAHGTATSHSGLLKAVLVGALLLDVACVNRAIVGGATSTMSAVPPVAPADGSTPIIVSIYVAPELGKLPADARVVVTSTDGNAVIAQPAGLVEQSNAFIATVRSLQAGAQTLTAELICDGMRLPINATAVITFDAVGTPSPWSVAAMNSAGAGMSANSCVILNGGGDVGHDLRRA